MKVATLRMLLPTRATGLPTSNACLWPSESRIRMKDANYCSSLPCTDLDSDTKDEGLNVDLEMKTP